MPTVIGLFDERAEAMRAYDALLNRGFRSVDLDILTNDFRTYYTQRLAKSGLGYDKYSPAFRFGYGLAANEPFRSQPWETIEPDVRRLWEEKNPGTWGQLKDAVRFSWERARGSR